ncbi:MAG TPA: hypothetical protein IAD26_04470 [Candidatus Limenecus avicola]|jgi:hypothetical protein|uniref:Uncharacterized protein n=1 Tax=Candidatus Limenecus avicola TaxID=2840847 RepID=A0A9D1N0D6_9CLOT|nr:unknown [Clostridium sp. CAG:306]HIU92371.1 hypothetical protein [Candidatus Limenecus avicola]
MDFSKGVLFDPGYSKYTLPFSQNIDAAYNMILSIKAPHQRKFKFQMVYPQLLKLLEHTISFYLGCLLWATFISKNFKDNPKEILDNHYIGQKIKEDEMLFEVNYAIGYIEKLKKDCKYYLGKTCNLPDDWMQIMQIYKEFLMVNEFLVEAKSSADIKLPLAIKEPSQDDLNKILEQIELVVKSGELKELFKVKKLIID